jgi:hypothetical protein
MMAGQLKVVCYGVIRIGIGGLALFAFLDFEILIQIDIDTDISVAIKADTGVFHRVFICNVGIFIALRCFIVVLVMNKHT